MSGGSWGYLYSKDPFPLREALEEMAVRLDELGSADGAEMFRTFVAEQNALYEKWKTRFSPIAQAIEWHDSSDWGMDQVNDAVSRAKHVPSLHIDFAKEQFFRDGLEVHLTKSEREVLTCIVQGKGRPVSDQELSEVTAFASVKVHILRIREKLGENVIANVHGVGYKWVFNPHPCPGCGRVG